MAADDNGVRTSAWLGPKGTVSPLHYDPYHNLLTQVLGYKYLRIFSPQQSKCLYPRSVRASAMCFANFSPTKNYVRARVCVLHARVFG